MRQLFVMFVLAAACVSADAQQLFFPVQEPVQPIPAIAGIMAGAPEAQARQVRVNEAYFLAQAEADGPSELVVNLFPDVVVHSKREKIVRKGDTLLWTGTVEGPNVFGKAIFAVTGKIVVGLVQRDRRMFLIRPITTGVLHIGEIRQRLLPPEGIPVDAPNLFPVPPPPPQPAELKVMLVWDAAFGAICAFPAIGTSYELAFEGLLNGVWSEFTSVSITADVTNMCTSHSAAGGNLSSDLTWVSTNATVAAERDAREADLVSYIVPESTLCGLANYNVPPVNAGDDDIAFSLVTDDCALSNYSLPHELGHNLGMAHDRTQMGGGSPGICAYGYWITLNAAPYLRTVMAYDCPTGCERIGVHSNPTSGYVGWPYNGTVQYGEACSSATSADNVSQLEAAASVVAGFRP